MKIGKFEHASLFLFFTLIFTFSNAAQTSQNLPMREDNIEINPLDYLNIDPLDISTPASSSDSFVFSNKRPKDLYKTVNSTKTEGIYNDIEEAANKIITKSTVVYPRYGYTTTYTWQPCVDYGDQVVLSGGYKLQQTPDKNASKLSLDGHGYYTDTGWTWKITNKNNTNLAVNLYVQCGPEPLDYAQAFKSQEATEYEEMLGVVCPEMHALPPDPRGIGTGFLRPHDYSILGSYAYHEPDPYYYTSDVGYLSVFYPGFDSDETGPISEDVSQSVVCGSAYGEKNTWGEYNGEYEPQLVFQVTEGPLTTIEPGVTKTLSLKCYEGTFFNSYFSPLSAGFYTSNDPYSSDSDTLPPQVISNYVLGGVAYLTIKNPNTATWARPRDIYVRITGTCPF